MSELLTPPEDITEDIDAYKYRLYEFRHQAYLPKMLFDELDHIMIKSSDPADFSEKVRAIKPWAEGGLVVFTEVDSRFLVAAKLMVSFAQIERKPLDWLEIMESKSPDGTVDYFGLEYAEFFFNDFARAERFLQKRSVRYEQRNDDSHRWLNVPLQNGQEFHLTDKRLVDTINDELDSGTARLI